MKEIPDFEGTYYIRALIMTIKESAKMHLVYRLCPNKLIFTQIPTTADFDKSGLFSL